MSTTTLMVLGIPVWLLLAVGLALVIARTVRLRDRQTPPADEAPPEPPNGRPDTYSQPRREPYHRDGD